MKKALLVGLLFFVNSAIFAQEGGNRIYGNRGYYNQNKRQPQTATGSLTSQEFSKYAIEASVLLNVKADAFVAVYSMAREGKTANESNSAVNGTIGEFSGELSRLGIAKNDTFVDFIAQNRIYDYALQGDKAIEKLRGFETKKNIAVRYQNRDLLEKISTAATASGIFDLVKVDYVVADFDQVRNRLFDEATKVIKVKEARYTSLLGTNLTPFALTSEKYDAFYPSERYENYQAFESGDANANYGSGGTITKRKSTTFFYEPLGAEKFDRVVNAIGIEPVVQFTLYLRLDYDVPKARRSN